MPLWGKINQKNNAPKFKVVESQVAAGPSKGTNTLFNNTSVGVFHPGQVLGVWGANASQVTGANAGKISHTGWHLTRQGTGPVTAVTISVGGTGFANLAVGTVTSPQAGGNASFFATTNATGGLTAITMVNKGAGFVNTSATITAPANGIINVAFGGGLGYSNADTIVFSNGQVNATATLVTNATGGITAVTLTSAGRGFPSNTGTVVTITTAGGTNGNVVVNVLGAGSGQTLALVLGGRAGRLHYECLVAGSITGSPPATLP
jgi:hypothetical protein